jgi:ubiquinone/menaquinone biosynthesis C-methylase UbiE
MKITENKRVCPWWMGYVLLIPIRKFSHNPKKILAPFIKPGMKVIDYGSAMGYFSLPMAKMVGKSGKVYCFDIQQKMLDKLKNHVIKAGLTGIIEPKLITGSETDFQGMEQIADFALLFAVAHEVPDQESLFANLYRMLKHGANLYFSEPPGHVKPREFVRSVNLAEKAGFINVSSGNSQKLTALFQKV